MNVDDLFDYEDWDNSDIPFIVTSLVIALMEENLQLSTREAWQLFEDDIHAENQIRRKKAEEHARMQMQVRQFWEKYFPDLMTTYIDKPMFKEANLDERIANVLADADPAIVEMMTQVSIPGIYSNSVRRWIEEIVKQATD